MRKKLRQVSVNKSNNIEREEDRQQNTSDIFMIAITNDDVSNLTQSLFFKIPTIEIIALMLDTTLT